MTIDPRHPVIVGAHELSVRSSDAEPVAMMVEAAAGALAETNNVLHRLVDSVRVVKGIWPYADPGKLVADGLSLGDVTTGTTQIGGNATYDLVNDTAARIVEGTIDVAVICGAESMRTRRADKAAGRRSPYLDEPGSAAPGVVIGSDVDLVDSADIAAGISQPVNFYAMAESAIRHRRGESPRDHLLRISNLWARGSEVASNNPHAWITDRLSAEEIAQPSPTNRMVAAPYTKLLTSNINVDQGAAVVVAAYSVASAAGIADDRMIFLASGSGAYDRLRIREREALDSSPALRSAAERALELAALGIDDIEHLDLYSCFPSSVQLAQVELGIPQDRQFTITGGLTFAGGPYNGYCTQALAHMVSVLRGTAERAFLYGNGGFFTKHSVLVASGAPVERPFRYERTQPLVDAMPGRPLATRVAAAGSLEAYTVIYNRQNEPQHAIASVLDAGGCRHWAVTGNGGIVDALLSDDQVGREVSLTHGDPDSPPEITLS